MSRRQPSNEGPRTKFLEFEGCVFEGDAEAQRRPNGRRIRHAQQVGRRRVGSDDDDDDDVVLVVRYDDSRESVCVVTHLVSDNKKGYIV